MLFRQFSRIFWKFKQIWKAIIVFFAMKLLPHGNKHFYVTAVKGGNTGDVTQESQEKNIAQQSDQELRLSGDAFITRKLTCQWQRVRD